MYVLCFYIFSANAMLHCLQMGSTVVAVVEVVIVPTVLVYYTNTIVHYTY